ncbi:MAG: 2-C-methyl-D-erythritol 2,4-cyclodiphosphate synthase [Treponema sp.]|nr:2-C-methyl-D-erythritol 2,4-cyclodiphosphate synthase [Candidatus Treponema caballi]
MKSKSTFALILTAAGSSVRMGLGLKKEFLPMQDGTVLSTAIKSFLKTNGLTHIIITYPDGQLEDMKKALFSSSETEQLLSQCGIPLLFEKGGATRQESVFNALNALAAGCAQKPELVLIHDAARPWVTETVIQNVLECAGEYGAAVPSTPATDTLAFTDESKEIITGYADRPHTFCLQTPQGFRFNELLEAHRKAAADKNTSCTDDTTIWAAYCGPVHLCEGNARNKKITFKEDIQTEAAMQIRTGLGYDLHKLVEGRKLMLGGVAIPFEKGEDGHSDGDVLLHAITDALLGAAGIADIGELFPPSDNTWKDADSGKLLQAAWQKVLADGWKLENLDCVVALEKPKFLPYRTQVRESIAALLGCDTDKVFVKAKTSEGLGEIGRGEAAAVWATCLISRPFRNNQE